MKASLDPIQLGDYQNISPFVKISHGCTSNRWQTRIIAYSGPGNCKLKTLLKILYKNLQKFIKLLVLITFNKIKKMDNLEQKF